MYIGRMDFHAQMGLNSTAINRSVARQNEAHTGKKAEDTLQDNFTLSPQGQKQSLLEQLMKQREDLIERKKQVSTQENGTDLKAQLQAYDEQIAALDEQIQQLSMEQEEKPKQETTGIYQKPKTEQQIEAEKTGHLLQLSGIDHQTEMIASVRKALVGQANVLNAQLKTGYNGDAAGKIQKVAELNQKASGLQSEIVDKISEILQTITEHTQEQQKEEEEPNVLTALDILQARKESIQSNLE